MSFLSRYLVILTAIFHAAECFIVCKNLDLPAGFSHASLMAQWQGAAQCKEDLTDAEKVLVPFLFGGDLAGYDEQ